MADAREERWIVDLRDYGGYFLKTADGRVIEEGLSQAEARRRANAHNGDAAYPEHD